MAPWTGTDEADFELLTRRRAVLSIEIEKLLLRKNLIGDWTLQQRATYASLCDEERRLLERMTLLECRA